MADINPNIIDKDDYLLIAQSYAKAVAPVVGVADYYLDAASIIADLDHQYIPIDLDLLRPFYNAYLTATSIYSSTPSTAVDAVRTLQEHVIRRSGAEDIPTWWTTTGRSGLEGEWGAARDIAEITTDGDMELFAALSSAAGYPLT